MRRRPSKAIQVHRQIFKTLWHQLAAQAYGYLSERLLQLQEAPQERQEEGESFRPQTDREDIP